MTQLSENIDPSSAELCRALYNFAQNWAAENPDELPPCVVHFCDRTVALFVAHGLRKGKPMFSAKRALREQIAAAMPAEPAEVAASRKGFESWRRQSGYRDQRDRFGRYTTPEGRAAWHAWQASRSQMLSVPAPSAEVLVSEHQKAYEFARMQGKGVQAAELEAVRAIQSALLPAQARTLNGQHDVHMAA